MKKFLSAKGQAFDVIDVTASPDAAQEVVNLTGAIGVPVTVKGAQVVRGFDKAKLEKLIAS